jgi:hypothetical protein
MRFAEQRRLKVLVRLAAFRLGFFMTVLVLQLGLLILKLGQEVVSRYSIAVFSRRYYVVEIYFQ